MAKVWTLYGKCDATGGFRLSGMKTRTIYENPKSLMLLEKENVKIAYHSLWSCFPSLHNLSAPDYYFFLWYFLRYLSADPPHKGYIKRTYFVMKGTPKPEIYLPTRCFSVFIEIQLSSKEGFPMNFPTVTFQETFY